MTLEVSSLPYGDTPQYPIQILEQPFQFMGALAAIDDGLAFYSHDMEGRFKYLSPSTESVLNLDPQQWINHSFSEALTDSTCNDHIRSGEWKTANHKASCHICEIYDRDGDKLRLQYWRAHVFHDGVPIGIAGMIRRLHTGVGDPEGMTSEDEQALMARVRSLSSVERQVIELVVDGNMNKKMASLLDVAVRTIESRRSRAMNKLQAKTLPELVQIWIHVRRIESKGKIVPRSPHLFTDTRSLVVQGESVPPI